MPTLLSFLSSEHSWATQTSAGDFLKAIITISANASQNEQSCIGPNELTRQLVSQECVEKLISDMLKGGNPLTVGVGIVIEVIRKNNSDYDPEVGSEADSTPSSRDPIYLGTLLRLFAKHIPDFMTLILSPNHTIGGGDGPVTIRRKELNAAFGGKIEPLGFDRFKTCELMAELLHCSNMGLLNEIGSEEYIHARDQERERLRVEGKLTAANTSRRTSEVDDLAMKTSTTVQSDSDSPETRRLEIQNASDDDGFEEVTHATDLGDDAKDDFDEKPDMDSLITRSTQSEAELSPSFLEKDDGEFVDEPLSSPRLDSEPGNFKSEDVPDPSLTVLPLSPSKDLANDVATLNVNADASSESTSSETTPARNTPAVADSDVETLDKLEKTTESAATLESAASGDDTAKSSEKSPGLDLDARELSPHPEDKPAPLFFQKSDDDNGEDVTDTTNSNETRSESATASPVDIDTTMADVANTSNVTLPTTAEDEPSFAGTEIDAASATPVVGDYLKMQFVEHKVVPTIIVSALPNLDSWMLKTGFRIFSSAFHGIIFYITSSTM